MNRRSFLHHAAAVTGGFTLSASSTSFAAWKENATLPNLATFGLEGDLPNTNGKVVYLDFWASWCAPCKASFPVLASWHKEFASEGFLVLGISVDEEASAMQSFLAKNPVGFPVVRDAAQKLVAAADVKTMPTSFLVDRQGVIRVVHNGFREKDAPALKAKIKELLTA